MAAFFSRRNAQDLMTALQLACVNEGRLEPLWGLRCSFQITPKHFEIFQVKPESLSGTEIVISRLHSRTLSDTLNRND